MAKVTVYGIVHQRSGWLQKVMLIQMSTRSSGLENYASEIKSLLYEVYPAVLAPKISVQCSMAVQHSVILTMNSRIL